MSHFTGLSFIVCHRDEEDLTTTLSSIHNCFKGIEARYQNYEIITVRGNHPSLQRNIAADEALFSHIYFLDNDSILDQEGLKYLIGRLVSPGTETIQIIGGPSVIPPQADYFERCLDGLLTSYLVVGKRCARYRPAGKERFSDGTELILCNMVISKKCFISVGRFDIRLYPNEENEFMHRVHRTQKKILYAPAMIVYRHQRKNYPAFINQMINYGRGKAEEIRIELSPFRLTLLRISVIVFFAVLTGVLLIGIGEEIGLINPLLHLKVWLPHLVLWYSVYLFWSMAKASGRVKKILLHFPVLFILGHLFYGFSLVGSLLKKGYVSKRKFAWLKITKK